MGSSAGGDDRAEDGGGGPVGPLLEKKEDGVAVLVTGAVPDAVHRSMSARLLGSPGVDRRRVLALTRHDEAAVTDRLPPRASTSPDRLRVVLGNGWTRSAGAAVGDPSGSGPGHDGSTVSDVGGTGDSPLGTLPEESVTALSDPSLATFGERLSRKVGALNRLADGFQPGQLRLCLDSLDHLTASYDDSQVLRFAHLVADQVRSHDGMAHFHTRRPHDDLSIAGIADVTEVVIRLRLTGEAPEFRPSLDGEPLTDWARIPPFPD